MTTTATHPPPRRFAVLAHPDLEDAMAEGELVARRLRESAVEEVIYGSIFDEALRDRVTHEDFDMLIALGGDGTMLRASHLCAPRGVPVLGINLGRFGFLIEVRRSEWQKYIPCILEGNYRLEERMLLRAELHHGGECRAMRSVVNDVVVCRGQTVRPIHIKATVDGHPLTTYVADGLIAATPTGSTAYSLAVGGPILPPELRNILLIPVAPHLSMDRAIILADGARVTISTHSYHQAVLSIDGSPPFTMENDDEVHVQAEDYHLRFVRFQDPGYFYQNITAYMQRNPATQA